MGDSQAVKNTCCAGAASKGFCFYKVTNGIKRHLLVDILGFPFFTLCTPANVADDVGLVMDASDEHRVLPTQTDERAKDYDIAGQRLSPRQANESASGSVSKHLEEGTL